MSKNAIAKPQEQAPMSLFAKIASKYSIDEGKLLVTLKQTAFRQGADKPAVSDEQMTALLIVADQYGLNPFTKEIFAYPDKNNGIVPVVGVDGWSRIINEHPQLDGIEFVYSEETTKHKNKTVHNWIECRISRKDRAKPIVVREFFEEVVRTPNFATPWDSHPNRMHRHKTLIQCSRVAFGFAGIYDEDEAARIVDMGDAEVVGKQPITQPQRKSEQSAPDQKPAPANEAKTEQPQAETAGGGGELMLGQNQLKLIKAKLSACSGAGESELFAAFGVKALEQIPASKVNDVLEWIKKNG